MNWPPMWRRWTDICSWGYFSSLSGDSGRISLQKGLFVFYTPYWAYIISLGISLWYIQSTAAISDHSGILIASFVLFLLTIFTLGTVGEETNSKPSKIEPFRSFINSDRLEDMTLAHFRFFYPCNYWESKLYHVRPRHKNPTLER